VHRRHGLWCSAHLDLCCGPAPKDVEEEFARRTAESSPRLAWSNGHQLVGCGQLDLEPGVVQPPTQIATASANIPPHGAIQCRRDAAGPKPVRSANVFVVNEELVQIREGSDPSDAKEPDGRPRPDPPDEPCEVLALGQLDPPPLGEALGGPRQNEARAGHQIAFSRHDVGSEIVGSPTLEQCGNGWTELVEEIAQCKALLRVERDISHAAEVYGGFDAAAWAI
jgi:hypothetical protein